VTDLQAVATAAQGMIVPTLAKSAEVIVAFAGEGAGTGDLAWGQWEIWSAIEHRGRSIGMGGIMVLPPGTTVDDLVAVLSFAVSRHQSLRTRFRCDERGYPIEQIVHDRGEVTLDVYDVPAGADVLAAAEALRAEYADRQYDYANEWPVRMAMVRQHGVPAYAVVMYLHLVIDGHGLDALRRDLANLDRTSGTATAPPTGLHPLEQAAAQASPAGRRQNTMALRHWERILRSLPPQLAALAAPRPVGPDVARYQRVSLRSAASFTALSAICARAEVDSTPVLMAALAVALARRSATNPRAIRALFSNRYRPGFAQSVSAVSQHGLLAVDVADATFDEVVRRVWRGLVGAGMHAYLDPRSLQALIATIGQDRAEGRAGAPELECYFNDARLTRPLRPGPPPTEAELGVALARTELRRESWHEMPDGLLYMVLDEDLSGMTDTVAFDICADAHYWPPDAIEDLARWIEQILVDAVVEPLATVFQVAANSTR
jgi:Condensation domain